MHEDRDHDGNQFTPRKPGQRPDPREREDLLSWVERALMGGATRPADVLESIPDLGTWDTAKSYMADVRSEWRRDGLGEDFSDARAEMIAVVRATRRRAFVAQGRTEKPSEIDRLGRLIDKLIERECYLLGLDPKDIDGRKRRDEVRVDGLTDAEFNAKLAELERELGYPGDEAAKNQPPSLPPPVLRGEESGTPSTRPAEGAARCAPTADPPNPSDATPLPASPRVAGGGVSHPSPQHGEGPGEGSILHPDTRENPSSARIDPTNPTETGGENVKNPNSARMGDTKPTKRRAGSGAPGRRRAGAPYGRAGRSSSPPRRRPGPGPGRGARSAARAGRAGSRSRPGARGVRRSTPAPGRASGPCAGGRGPIRGAA